MASVWGMAASAQPAQKQSRSERRPLGAGERRQWSSLLRQADIATVQAYMADPHFYGAVISGPYGVGKTTLASNVVRGLEGLCHTIKLFGTGVSTNSPYAIFSVQLARLGVCPDADPSTMVAGLVEQISRDAQGLPIVLMLDELPEIDALSMGVLMHLVLGGKAKLLVAARSLAELPEDLAWMTKDGLLANHRLAPFSRTEVRELLAKALHEPVAEAVVASLYSTSAGNPLVLQALVHEYMTSGVLRAFDGVWIQVGSPVPCTGDVLPELLQSRTARESPQMRSDLEKFSLLNNVPLTVAMQLLGSDALAVLEERGFLTIASNRHKSVGFAEPYVGQTLRNQLSPAQKADHFREVSNLLDLQAARLSRQELVVFTSWIHEAGLAMAPDMALAGAQAALHLFDPQLALACASHIPVDHPLTVQAVQVRSRAHHLMADYAAAAEILEGIAPATLEALSATEFAAWTMNLTAALVWLPQTRSRIERILALAAEKIQDADAAERPGAEKLHNLARFEFHINCGEFTQVFHELQIAAKDSTDRSYRLNSACLLTMALAATGHELEAVELSAVIEEEAARHDVELGMRNWQMYGKVMALIWSGSWRACASALHLALENSNNSLHHRGGDIELALGVVYAFAEQNTQAAEILLIAAAQLEVRNMSAGLELVYSLLACVLARLDDKEQGRRYLSLAKSSTPHALWAVRTLSDYFQALAAHALGDPQALGRLVLVAEKDMAAGRPSPAANGLRAAAMGGTAGLEEQLEQAAQCCQGALAGIGLQLARATRAGGAEGARAALAAATRAGGLELHELERQARRLALDLATAAGDRGLQREARNGLRGLESRALKAQGQDSGAALLTPRELQVARQAIGGSSNRDMAAAIGVSVRTIEGHLYQVFAKLGIASRAELEKWVDL